MSCVAELVVGVALAAQARAVERDRAASSATRARVELPAVRREQPRPAERRRRRAASRSPAAARRRAAISSATAPVADQEERSAALALAEQRSPARSARCARSRRSARGARGSRPAKRRDVGDQSRQAHPVIARADRRHLLGDVDADRAPGDAAPAADAARACRTGRTRSRACGSSTGGSASARSRARCRRGCASSRP